MGSAAAAGGEGYQIERSLKFYGAIPHLAKASNFQPTSPYTVSVWVKRASLDLGRTQFLWRINSADCLYFTTSSTLSWERRPTTLTTTVYIEIQLIGIISFAKVSRVLCIYMSTEVWFLPIQVQLQILTLPEQ